ncbi:coiled-coil domain-containing protein 134-like [Agrilus planipennis]|uniref:Coiled-coil domain-containing protein 134-like n=1 Tax=Agrilus planipennis TaxID=224129 RepID=A0A1W4WIM3_AGRPL|nr:coiled-coil domain-containing protein 134-like [Agrilus planipennis]
MSCIVSIILQVHILHLVCGLTQLPEEVYKTLFKQRRAEQLAAVKNLKKLSNIEKQHSMINLMAEKVFSIFEDCRAHIESSGYIPGISEFPNDEKVRDCLSNILENTALFSEVVLRFPDVADVILKQNNKWDIQLQWTIAFCYQVEHLLDKSTMKLLNLVNQELNYTERDPNYLNPYRKTVSLKTTNNTNTSVKDKKKTKKVSKKGPKLANFGEL